GCGGRRARHRAGRVRRCGPVGARRPTRRHLRRGAAGRRAVAGGPARRFRRAASAGAGGGGAGWPRGSRRQRAGGGAGRDRGHVRPPGTAGRRGPDGRRAGPGAGLGGRCRPAMAGADQQQRPARPGGAGRGPARPGRSGAAVIRPPGTPGRTARGDGGGRRRRPPGPRPGGGGPAPHAGHCGGGRPAGSRSRAAGGARGGAGGDRGGEGGRPGHHPLRGPAAGGAGAVPRAVDRGGDQPLAEAAAGRHPPPGGRPARHTRGRPGPDREWPGAAGVTVPAAGERVVHPPRGREAGRGVSRELVTQVRQRLVRAGHPATQAAVVAAVREEPAAAAFGDAALLQVADQVHADLVGAGALTPLLAAEEVTDVLVNGGEVWVDRGHGLRRAPVDLGGREQVRRLAQRLAAAGGRRLDDASPCVDVRLADGTRLHAVLPPVAPDGPLLSLRTFRPRPFTLADLVSAGTFTAEVAELLAAVVAARLAYLVTGGTGTGKTTLLCSLLSLVPHDERILVVEDSAELRPVHPHVAALQARVANVEG